MTIVRIILGCVLIGALVFAGWRIYRSLPSTPTEQMQTNEVASKSELAIFLRNDVAVAPAELKVELYPIDFTAAQRDFLSNTRPGKTLDDFLAQRMKGLEPVQAQMDSRGRAVTKLDEGHWWIRATATLTNGEVLEWRLPIVVAGRAQTIELSVDNAYEKTKKF